MTSAIEKLLSEQHWMIHDLRDADEISNDGEEKLYELRDDARTQYKKMKDWMIKAYEWFETQDNISVNSVAYKELEEIVKEII